MTPSVWRELPLWAATAVLAPLLLTQGRHVRRVTPKLPEPDGAREGQDGDGSLLRLLILGDSAAAGVGAASQDEALSGCLRRELSTRCRLQWQLLARTGATTTEASGMVRDAPGSSFDVALISLGVNDATALRSSQAFLADYSALVTLLKTQCGVGFVLASGLPPVHAFPALPPPLQQILGAHARRLDRVLADWCEAQPDVEHLPFGELPGPEVMAGDGFHPGPPIYAHWAEAAARRIERRLATGEGDVGVALDYAASP